MSRTTAAPVPTRREASNGCRDTLKRTKEKKTSTAALLRGEVWRLLSSPADRRARPVVSSSTLPCPPCPTPARSQRRRATPSLPAGRRACPVDVIFLRAAGSPPLLHPRKHRRSERSRGRVVQAEGRYM
jgi:hypothetical protein